ncbi:4Fe-4S dicluster domain-containing protein [Brevibacillus fluminis]|nr:4Fe-4S dicluster domain-containing protein [Brevibacillus fluminis]
MISEENRIVFYLLAAIATLIFIYGFYRRFKLWQKGRREKIKWSDVKTNAHFFWKMVVQQKKIQIDRLYGVMHRFTSYGFVALFIGTVLVVIDYDFGVPLLRGNFYLVYKVVLDIFGVLFLAGVLIAIIIRMKKQRLRLWYSIRDNMLLWLLFIIGVGGFILEGIRIASTKVSYGIWSPIGYTLSRLFQDVSLFSVDMYVFWWFVHSIFVFVLIAVIPYTKLFHILTAPIQILMHPVKRTGTILLPYDLQTITDEALLQSPSVLGVNKISDFTNWQLLSTDACTECGRCDSVCPAYQSEKPLSPRNVVTKIRNHMHQTYEISTFISPSELQSCTTCGACVEACPVSINHIDLILGMRRGLIQRNILELEAENTLMKVEEQYNIWGKPWSERANWSRGLQVPSLDHENVSKSKEA